MGFDKSDTDLEDLFKQLQLKEDDLNKKQSSIHTWLSRINNIKLIESREYQTIDEKQVLVTKFSLPIGPSGDILDEQTRDSDKQKLVENITKFLKQ